MAPGPRLISPPCFLPKNQPFNAGSKGAGVSVVILGETRQEVHLRIKSASGSFVCWVWQLAVLAGSSAFGIFGIFDGPRALFGCKSVFQMIES